LHSQAFTLRKRKREKRKRQKEKGEEEKITACSSAQSTQNLDLFLCRTAKHPKLASTHAPDFFTFSSQKKFD
jgi:CelD/BcsL family acetyltransferase involved in cellulose biosynthesis